MLPHLLALFFFLMIRRPPRSTRTDTLFPYTTLFRIRNAGVTGSSPVSGTIFAIRYLLSLERRAGRIRGLGYPRISSGGRSALRILKGSHVLRSGAPPPARSAERRVGKTCVSPCRSRESPDQYKKNKPT